MSEFDDSQNPVTDDFNTAIGMFISIKPQPCSGHDHKYVS